MKNGVKKIIMFQRNNRNSMRQSETPIDLAKDHIVDSQKHIHEKTNFLKQMFDDMLKC